MISASQVNRAGRMVRRAYRHGSDYQQDDWLKWSAAIELIVAYRAAHQYPLIKATAGLRSMCRTAGVEAQITQRLKRLDTILDKLHREPTMKLSTMQDIGGCRAVLNSIQDVRRVEHRLRRRNPPPLRLRDYIDRPRQSGYRAVHVIVGYRDRTGQERAIEVQLRTRVMHDWAIFVERLSGRLAEDLKGGQGPKPVVDFLVLASEAMALEEEGKIVPRWLVERLTAQRQLAVPYLERT